jgi:hypothetical protein
MFVVWLCVLIICAVSLNSTDPRLCPFSHHLSSGPSISLHSISQLPPSAQTKTNPHRKLVTIIKLIIHLIFATSSVTIQRHRLVETPLSTLIQRLGLRLDVQRAFGNQDLSQCESGLFGFLEVGFYDAWFVVGGSAF